MPRRDTPRRHAALIGRALAHVETHLADALDADTLADRAAMSRFHFHRAFHAHVGCSVGSYVTWRRLQRACALLASGSETVLEVALAVGYDSAQALAKAMRRELDTTPGAMRRGDAAAWNTLLDIRRLRGADPLLHADTPMTLPPAPRRLVTIAPVTVLTATARGMVDGHMTRAAQRAFGELSRALARQRLIPRVRSWLGALLDAPRGIDDPHCRYLAAVAFVDTLNAGRAGGHPRGAPGPDARPAIELDGSLAWRTLDGGRHAVFDHVGPYTELHAVWRTVYRDWLPASGERLRDALPFEVNLNSPADTPPEALHTELWVPLA